VRVLLDATYATRTPHSGTGVYLVQLAAALSAIDSLEVVSVSNAARRAPAGGGLGSVQNAVADQWWTERELPRLARAAMAEAIHHPLPAHAWTSGIPQVMTVHDLAFERHPELFDPRFRRYAHLVHRAAARRAAAVVCVSHATAEDVVELWGVPRARIVVAQHGPGQGLARLERGEPTHFLYVGDDEPRKDLDGLLAAYRGYRRANPAPLDLVLAGPFARGPLSAGVRRVVEASPDRLARLHAGAAALLHPALAEGFGLTLLEAMSVGTPVIAAANAAVAEVCGDGARYVEARRPDALAAAMEALAGDGAVRRGLSERGIARAAQFSWRTSAHRHLEAYSLAVVR
jgi:glycosyltransferase involved in cell wall biosynthesis